MQRPWTSLESGTYVRRPGQVLIVDDEEPLATALRRELASDNQVVLARDGAEAIARVGKGETYDVLLCELMMPIMDGVELHRRLSATHPGMAARMVFMTAEATTSRVEAFFNRVPNLLLQKPVDIDGLRALIARRVGKDERAATGS